MYTIENGEVTTGWAYCHFGDKRWGGHKMANFAMALFLNGPLIRTK